MKRSDNSKPSLAAVPFICCIPYHCRLLEETMSIPTVRQLLLACTTSLIAWGAQPAFASMGGSTTCASSDGQLILDRLDNTLKKGGEEKRFRIADQTPISFERKVCRSTTGEAFNIYKQEYFLTLEVEGEPVRLFCESSMDTSPATACSSDSATDEVAERVEQSPMMTSATPAISSPGNYFQTAEYFNHNGSVIAYAHQRLIYVKPRDGLTVRGVDIGTTLVEMFSSENGIDCGTAYIFTASCGRWPYKVCGRIAANAGTGILRGSRPVVSNQCQLQASAPDELIFTPLPKP